MKVKATNNSDRPVFIPGGKLLPGETVECYMTQHVQDHFRHHQPDVDIEVLDTPKKKAVKKKAKKRKSSDVRL